MKYMNEIPEPLSIMGVDVTPFRSFEEAVDCMSYRISNREKTFCVAINPEKIFRALRDERLRIALGKAHIGACDGIGAVIAAKILYGRAIRRCTDGLLSKLMSVSAENSWRVFLLGASPSSNRKAVENFQKTYPELNIVGHRDGYFESSREVVTEINNSKADIVVVALGSPKQELWIAENMDAISACFFMGVGGALDVASGKVTRAPVFFRKTGTEFLYRLITNPKRIKRQSCLPLFAFKLVTTKLFGLNTNGHKKMRTTEL